LPFIFLFLSVYSLPSLGYHLLLHVLNINEVDNLSTPVDSKMRSQVAVNQKYSVPYGNTIKESEKPPA
jgi:hypothetical protein